MLSVKLDIPDAFKNDIYTFVNKEYLKKGVAYKKRFDLFQSAFEEAYSKKCKPFIVFFLFIVIIHLFFAVVPLITRQIRGELTKMAETASVEVFATNLKQLLLMSPVKGEKILGIDPGFSNGCKVALISECTDVLETAIIYPHTQPKKGYMYGERIAELMKKHK